MFEILNHSLKTWTTKKQKLIHLDKINLSKSNKRPQKGFEGLPRTTKRVPAHSRATKRYPKKESNHHQNKNKETGPKGNPPNPLRILNNCEELQNCRISNKTSRSPGPFWSGPGREHRIRFWWSNCHNSNMPCNVTLKSINVVPRSLKIGAPRVWIWRQHENSNK